MVVAGVKLVGRDAELAQLNLALDAAVSGDGRAVVLSGDAGIGKTALADAVCAHADSRGFAVMRASASGGARPYQVVADALGGRLDMSDLFEAEASFSLVFAIDRSGAMFASAGAGANDAEAGQLASMLSAVQAFAADTFGVAAGLGRLEFAGKTLLVGNGETSSVVAVIDGAEHPDMAAAVRAAARALDDCMMTKTVGASHDGAEDAKVRASETLARLASARFAVRLDPLATKLEAERMRGSERVLVAVSSIAAESPALLLLDDLDSADEPSIQAAAHVARNACGMRLAVLLCCREATGALGKALESLNGLPHILHIALAPLDATAVGELVGATMGPHAFTRDLFEHLAERCTGNPLFILESLKAMESSGAIVVRDGERILAPGPVSLPGSMDDLVRARLDALSPEALALAEFASCAGIHADAEALSSFPGACDVAAALAELASAGLVTAKDGALEFTRPLYADVLHAGIAPRWRAAYHLRLGERLEALASSGACDVVFEVARHFSETDEHEKAIRYCVRAAELAEVSFAPERALELYALALSRAPHVPSLGAVFKAIRMRLGDLKTLVGDYAGALSDYGNLLELETDARGRAGIRCKIAVACSRQGNHKAAIEECEKGLGELGSLTGSERARLLGMRGWTEYITGDNEKALSTLQQALAEAERAADAREAAACRHRIGTLLGSRCDFAGALAELQKALNARERLGDLRGTAATEGNVGITLRDMGDLAGSEKHHMRSLEIFRRLGDLVGTANALGNLAIVERDRGNLQKSYALQDEAFRIRKRIGDLRGIAISHNNLGNVAKEMGEFDKALAHHRESVRIRTDIRDRTGVATSHYNIADVMMAMGDWHGAIVQLRESLMICHETNYFHLETYVRYGLAEALEKLGNAAVALAEARSALEIAEKLGLAVERAKCSALVERLEKHIAGSG